MNDEAAENQSSHAEPPQLLPWSKSEVFCINGYSGGAISACGWRGLKSDAHRGLRSFGWLCPRCGHATLLRIRN